ncbi:AraC family transcriptional regulator [Rhodoplanes sp. TEM]|uniref:AraC family transcriptional regulator n=1 Tax=Rhodoplanes tepidamans TaxID=200616 RepID=A0ABT5JIS4_RHOTP|nr:MULTISPECIES: AraC family transcriptional regulator [Rhodoplanes]MDC7789427.1 AraC family transcriptional regulator [Rhodoplanes tepidamans]MDC7987061.1 AraC family transcriptional regulator [Rhodoplanes sp. TEM]MDQ0353600.1 AraC family transcriptional regulator [Rhodoplanes tepidamans]
MRVDRAVLDRCLPQQGGWRDNTLALATGRIGFRTGRIGHGIVATASEMHSRAGYRSRIEHDADVAILTFGLAGTTRFGFGAAPTHDVQPGDVWLFRARTAEVERWTPGQPRAAMVAIKFDAARLGDTLDDTPHDVRAGTARAGTGAVRLGRIAGDPALHAVLANPLRSGLDRLMAESASLALLAEWLAAPAGATAPSRLAPEERRGLARVVDLLMADLCHPPSLDRLAVEAGMSHPRLNRCFRKAYGTTVFDWLRERRLDQASRLLRADDRSVTEIAYACGFSSPSHFAAAFRQRHGVSPVAFRRRPG